MILPYIWQKTHSFALRSTINQLLYFISTNDHNLYLFILPLHKTPGGIFLKKA